MLNLSSEYARKQIKENLFRFRDPGSMRFADSNIRRSYYWDKAKYRILFVFLSTVQSRAISATEQVLFNLIYTSFGYDVYPDLVYLPERENFHLFEELNIPVLLGSVTNRVWKDFDLILISNSTIEEKQNLPWMLHKSDIPIWYTQRMKDESIPFVFLGGNSSDMCDIYLGKSDYSDDFSLIDGAFIGQGEGLLEEMILKFIEGKKKGLKKEEFLRSFFSIKSFLHPEQFLYEYEPNGWHIKKIVKNPKFPEAPDRVEYNHQEDPNLFPGFERRIMLPLINTAPVSADIQISWACSSGGGCSFCKENYVQGGWREKTLEKIEEELIDLKMYSQTTKIGFFSFNCIKEDSIIPLKRGIKRIQHLINTDFLVSGKSYSKFSEFSYQGIRPCFKIKTLSGYSLEVTENHESPVLTLEGGMLKSTFEVKIGDYLILKRGFCEETQFNPKAWLAGLFFGDGSYNGKKVVQYVPKREIEIYESVLKIVKELNWWERDYDHCQCECLRNVCLTKEAAEFYRTVVGNKRDKLTDYFLNESKSFKASFIRGLFDADGGYSGRTLTLTSIRQNFLHEIQQILLIEFGIITHCSSRHSCLKGEFFECGYLSISGSESYELFEKLIGLTVKEKRDKLKRVIGVGSKDKVYPKELGMCVRKRILAQKGYPKKVSIPNGFISFCYGHTGINHKRLLKLISLLPDDFTIELREVVNNRIVFKPVSEIKYIGDFRVFDVVESDTGIFSCGGILTHNTNYYSKYIKVIKLAAKYFSRFVFIAMRADVIAKRPDYFMLSRQLKQKRISFGLEGLSRRVRNGYLNKNLSDEEFFQACEVCFRLRFVEIKLNIINTGIEDNDDIDEFIHMFQKLIERRDRLGSKTVFRISITNLCYYPETPLQWEKRRTVKQMMEKDRRWDRFFEEMGRRFKKDMWMDIGNLSGIQFVYPQFMLDLHRLMTPIMVKASLEQDIIYHRLLKPEQVDWLYGELKSRGYTLEELTAERPNDFIFPGSYIYTLKKGYLEMMRDNLRKALTERSEKSIGQCLATPAKPVKRKCTNCGYCTSSEMRKKRLVREFDTEATVDEALQEIAMNRPKYRMILKFTRREEYRYVNPMTSWYYGISRIFREMGKEEVVKVHKIEDCWDKLQSKDNMANFIYGSLMGTIHLTEMVSIEEMKLAYDRIKDEIETSVFDGGRSVPLNFKLDKHLYQMFIVNVYEQDYSIMEKVIGFDGRVKLVQKNGGSRDPKFTYFAVKDLPEILFFNGNHKAGSFFVVSIPYKLNIYAFISSILKISFHSVLQMSKALRICYFTKGMSVCSKCKKPAMYDLFSNKDSAFCEECYRRTLILKLKKRISND